MKWLNWSTIINIQEQSPTSIDFSYFFPPSEKEKKKLNLSDASQENSPTFLALLVGTIIVYSFVYSLIFFFFCVEHGNKKFTIIIVYDNMVQNWQQWNPEGPACCSKTKSACWSKHFQLSYTMQLIYHYLMT